MHSHAAILEIKEARISGPGRVLKVLRDAAASLMIRYHPAASPQFRQTVCAVSGSECRAASSARIQLI